MYVPETNPPTTSALSKSISLTEAETGAFKNSSLMR
jgi:hypothetical protein